MIKAGLKAKKSLKSKESVEEKHCRFGPPTDEDCRNAIANMDCPATEKNEKGDIPCLYNRGKNS